MTDRELLELAAKAAGIEYIPAECEKSKEAEMRFGFWLKFPDGYEVPEGVRRRWKPLTDDGDALRLAVKLQLTIHQWADEVCVCNEKGTVNEDIARVGNICAATRRAIVRAAAEIGRNMK